VLDYKMSNLHSATKALERVGADVVVIDGPDLPVVDGVVLPGVGHFGQAMERIRAQGLDRVVDRVMQTATPLLGICLGMQLLFEESEESPGSIGLGVLDGSVRRIETEEKLPSIGWREVRWSDDPERRDAYYFVHTYACVPTHDGIVWGTADYGTPHCAAVRRGLVTGVQFHPEKSSRAGLSLLERWLTTVTQASGVGAAA
jgi:glutamine amidotransferase